MVYEELKTDYNKYKRQPIDSKLVSPTVVVEARRIRLRDDAVDYSRAPWST